MMQHSKHLAPALLGLLLIAVLVRPSLAQDYANPRLLMQTGDLATLLDDPGLRILDVRSAEAYAESHIPGAFHLGADDVIDPDSHVEGDLLHATRLAAMLGALGVDRSTKVVLYDDNGGFHASRLFWMLEYFGHRRVALLNGGFPKWAKEGRDATRDVPQTEAKTFALTLTPRRLATADWLLDRQDDPSAVVIDVRPPKLFEAGHIPWARNLSWKQNLGAEATFKTAEELLANFAAHGVTKDKNVVVHCQNGKAAAHSYFTLRLLGFPRVRSYDRSWAEWGSAEDLPRAKGS